MDYQFMVRASSIASFFDCPSRWAEIHIEGLFLPSTAPSAIGTAVHKATAEYDRSRLDANEARWLSWNDAAGIADDLIRRPEEEVDWAGMQPDKASNIGLTCVRKYCDEIAPEQNYVQVEVLLDQLDIRIPVDNDTVTLSLTGTSDRVTEDAFEYKDEEGIPLVRQAYGIADIKTGARALTTIPGKHRPQLGVYELLVAHTTGFNIELPAQILALQTGGKDPGAQAIQVDRCTDILVGNDMRRGLLEHMAAMLKRGDFYGNPSSWLCHERYCPAWGDCYWR